MMAAGELKDPIQITNPVLSQNKFGSITATPSTPIRTMARVRQLSSSESIRNGMTQAVNNYECRIRWRDDVDDKCEIMYRGRAIEVFSVVEAGHSNREWLDILASEVKP